MHLDGNHRLKASCQTLWKLLNDPAVLIRTAPGLSELTPLSVDLYRAVFQIKVGPINSSFNGTVRVFEKVEPESYRLEVKVESRIGEVTAEGSIRLQAQGAEETEVFFVGDSKMTGVLARMGQRVLSGVARMITAQFFKALEAELAGEASGRS